MATQDDKGRTEWKQNPQLSKQVVDYYNQGYKPKQISEKMNIPAPRIRSHLTHLKKVSPQLFTQLSTVPSTLSSLKKEASAGCVKIEDEDEDDEEEDIEEEFIEKTKKRKITTLTQHKYAQSGGVPSYFSYSDVNYFYFFVVEERDVKLQIRIMEGSLTLSYTYLSPSDTVAKELNIPIPTYHRNVEEFTSQHVVYTSKPIETNLKLIKKQVIEKWRVLTIPWKSDDVNTLDFL